MSQSFMTAETGKKDAKITVTSKNLL